MVKAVQAEADKLKADGTDVIKVVLSHLGVDSGKRAQPLDRPVGRDSPALTSSSTATLHRYGKGR